MTSNPVLDGYASAAATLIPAWETLSSEQIYAPVAKFLPTSPARVLDVGAGIGGDAEWFTQLGYQVCAVEPVAALRTAGQSRQGIEWRSDLLPDLAGLGEAGRRFDLIICNGVLHHLPRDQQERALETFSGLLHPGGQMILSLRHGPTPSDRPGYGADTGALLRKAASLGLTTLHAARGIASHQAGNRANGVSWDWLVLSAE